LKGSSRMPEQDDDTTRNEAPVSPSVLRASGRPLSPSLRGHYDTWHWKQQPGHPDFGDLPPRPSSSPVDDLGNTLGESTLRSAATARPWTSASLASVKSFTTGYLASDSWNDLFAADFRPAQAEPEPNERTEKIACGIVSKVLVSCSDYRLLKREDDVRAFTGLWSTISFRRPRGMDIICEQARSARKPPVRVAEGFLSKGRSGQTPYEIALGVSLLQKLEGQNAGFIKLLVESGSLSFVTTVAGQVLYREGDPACCSYVQLSGSVQMYSRDRDFLKGAGWHPMETTDDDKGSSKLQKQATRGLGTPRTDYDPSRYPTLQEYVQKASRDEEAEALPRFRTVEGHSTFSKDSSYGELYDTHHAPGTLLGESALVGKELWQHSARCIKDCEFLAINALIFKQTLKKMRENQRFFDLYMPGLNKNRSLRPHPNEFFKREVVPEGDCLLEEGMVLLEPAVFMVQRGEVALRRCKMSSANPAYVLSTRPLVGKPQKVTTQDVTCLLLPEVARTFTPQLDEEGLPRIGLPPPLKGTMRQRLEDEYVADPSHFLPPRDKKLSPEEAKVRHHKALLKERLETIAVRKKERALKRDEELREARPLRQEAPEEPVRNDAELEKIRALLEYVSTLTAARPGSPEHIGEEGEDATWSHRPRRNWLSPDTFCGPYSRPASAEMFAERTLRKDYAPESQETITVLRTGDMFCSLSFFPIWGAPEPFSAVAASPDCCVVYVRGVHEAKSIPKVLLKEMRVELGRELQARLTALIATATATPSKEAKDSGEVPETPQPADPEKDAEETRDTDMPGMPQGVESVLAGASRQLESLSLPIPRRPSFQSSHSNRSLRSNADDSRSLGPGSSGSGRGLYSGFQSFEEPPPRARKRRKREKPVSFMRWLFFGKGTGKEQGASLGGRQSVKH